MRYLNFILTVIAVLLFLHLVKPAVGPERVYAKTWSTEIPQRPMPGAWTDVNIVAVAGQVIPFGQGLPTK